MAEAAAARVGEPTEEWKTHIPVILSHQHPGQLDVMAGAGVALPDGAGPLFDHVQQHLRQLRVFGEVDQVWQTVVHLKCNSCFLEARKKPTVTVSVKLSSSRNTKGP